MPVGYSKGFEDGLKLALLDCTRAAKRESARARRARGKGKDQSATNAASARCGMAQGLANEFRRVLRASGRPGSES